MFNLLTAFAILFGTAILGKITNHHPIYYLISSIMIAFLVLKGWTPTELFHVIVYIFAPMTFIYYQFSSLINGINRSNIPQSISFIGFILVMIGMMTYGIYLYKLYNLNHLK